MNTTEQRLAANRANAQLSTGPATAAGRAVASRNAMRHGLLSVRLLLDDEDHAEFAALCVDLAGSLNPADAIEAALVERIAVAIWRQRRLIKSETAVIELSRQPREIARGVSDQLRRGFGSEVREDELAPFDAEQEQWSRAVVAEIEALGDHDLAMIEQQAPHIWRQLVEDAEDDPGGPAKFIADQKGGIDAYISELCRWCREQIRHAEARPDLLLLAGQVRAKHLVLSGDVLELLARYQTTLDNQLYKALRALREAQEWRLKTVEASAAPGSPADLPGQLVEAA